jgi:L-ascorbate metabolism protein UlaG (beta-lactamase superfamily)
LDYNNVTGPVSFVFINHSTILLNYNGINILTDPIFSYKIKAWRERLQLPSIPLEKLPKIDLILLSHNHPDHFDPDSLKKIIAKDNPIIIIPDKNALYFIMNRIPVDAVEERWGDSFRYKNINITAVPAHHNSGRFILDSNYSKWCGYVISGEFGNIYFAGDTGFGEGIHFELIKKFFPNIKYAFLPIAPLKPEKFIGEYHLEPSEAIKAHQILQPEKSFAVHFGTFQQGDDLQFDVENNFKKEIELNHIENFYLTEHCKIY